MTEDPAMKVDVEDRKRQKENVSGRFLDTNKIKTSWLVCFH